MDSNFILSPINLNDLADVIIQRLGEHIHQSTRLKEAPISKGEIPIGFKEAMRVLGMKERTLRAKIASNEIPYYQPSPRQLYFFESELLQYIKNGKMKTAYEIEQEAIRYTKRRK